MRIITRKRLKEFGRKFADARRALEEWAEDVEAARWRNLAETRRAFSYADEVVVSSRRTATVFNIKGNRYRLIVAIHYNKQRVFVLRFLTHSEYNKNAWKRTL